MAHYAFLNGNNIVEMVIPGREEDDLENLPEKFSSWEEYYGDLHNKKCLRTSINTLGNEHHDGGTAFRGNYAGKGYTYNEENDVFIAPQPFDSWVLDTDTWTWNAPVDYPDDGLFYEWSEYAENWILIP